jgi:hypothetical protein
MPNRRHGQAQLIKLLAQSRGALPPGWALMTELHWEKQRGSALLPQGEF